jgi:hypothetical protein
MQARSLGSAPSGQPSNTQSPALSEQSRRDPRRQRRSFGRIFG